MKTSWWGFDGTEASFVALDWAAERAVRGPTRVEIVMIAGTILSDDFRIDASILEAEHGCVTALRTPRSAHGASQGGCRTLSSTMRAQQICSSSAPTEVARSRSVLARRLPLRIASHSRVPVVVVPDNWSPTWGPVVVGLDDDCSSGAALDRAAGEAGAAGVHARGGARLADAHPPDGGVHSTAGVTDPGQG